MAMEKKSVTVKLSTTVGFKAPTITKPCWYGEKCIKTANHKFPCKFVHPKGLTSCTWERSGCKAWVVNRSKLTRDELKALIGFLNTHNNRTFHFLGECPCAKVCSHGQNCNKRESCSYLHVPAEAYNCKHCDGFYLKQTYDAKGYRVPGDAYHLSKVGVTMKKMGLSFHFEGRCAAFNSDNLYTYQDEEKEERLYDDEEKSIQDEEEERLYDDEEKSIQDEEEKSIQDEKDVEEESIQDEKDVEINHPIQVRVQ